MYMTFDPTGEINRRQEEYLHLFASHVNPRLAKVLQLIDFARPYVRGRGAYLYDADGRDYLDFMAGYGVFAAGRNHPAIVSALKSYLDTDYPSMVQMDAPLLAGVLAEKLLALAPGDLAIVFFTNSGTEGVETALKFARCATGRSRVLYSEKDFHGLTLGSLSVNGSQDFRRGFEPLLPDTVAIPYGDIDALEAHLAPGDVAAFIVEPIQGKTITVPPAGFLAEAARLCRRHGAVLIADEVMTGFGRTGKLFACEWDGAEPDILVAAKALSGGFVPVGAVMCRQWIYDKVFSSLDRCVVHSNTFGRGGMAMTAGLATLDVIEREGLVENARHMGDALLTGLQELAASFPMIKDVRGRGLMLAIELQPPRSLWGRVSGAFMGKLSPGLLAQAFVVPLMSDHRILTQVGGHGADVIRLLPPLVIGKTDVARFLDAFRQVLEAANKFPGPIWEIGSRLAKLALRARSSAAGR
jgi:ornithine--oxo-acid transaminase